MNRNQRLRNTIVYLIALGVLLFGVYLYASHKVARMSTWPTVDAVIIDSKLSSIAEFHESHLGTTVITKPKLTISFNYSVDGRSYTSSCFYMWAYLPTSQTSREYAVGQHFTARYNPKDPSEAIRPAENDSSLLWMLLIWSIVSLVLAALTSIYRINLGKEGHISTARPNR